MPTIRRWRLVTRVPVTGKTNVIGAWLTYDGLMQWIHDGNPQPYVRYHIEHWENNRWKYLTTYTRQR